MISYGRVFAFPAPLNTSNPPLQSASHQVMLEKNTNAPSVDIDPPKEPASPERALLLGILEQAGRDAFGRRTLVAALSPLEYRRLIVWLEKRNTEDYPFTYSWICDHLNLCPEATLLALKERFAGKLSRDIRKRFHN